MMKLNTLLETIESFDKKVVLKYNGYGGAIITKFLKFISFFGRETIWLLIIAFYLFIWYDTFFLIHVTTTFLLGLLFIVPIKETIKRKRPYDKLDAIERLERKQASGSFPSWHCYNVFSQGLLIIFVFPFIVPSIIILSGAILVAFSRVQFGVHYPSDVVVGILLGISGFFLSYYLVSPLFLDSLLYLEQFSILPIYHQQINPMIFSEMWYLVLLIIVFGGIILSSVFKIVQDYFLNNKTE